MKMRIAVWSVVVCTSICIRLWGQSSWESEGLVVGGGSSQTAAQKQQQQIEKQRQRLLMLQFRGTPVQRQQAEAELKRLEAEEQRRAAAIVKIKDEARAAFEKVDGEYLPTINDLKSQVAALEQKAKDIETQNTPLVTRFVKPGPNHRVVNGEVYDSDNSELWKNPLDLAGFHPHSNINFRLLTYLAKIETVEADKIRCAVYEQAHWPPVAYGEVESEGLVQEIVIYHYPNAGSLISGQYLGECRCMRVANYNEHGISCAAFDCGVQSTKKVKEVVPGSPDAATLKMIEANQRKLSPLKQKLSEVQADYDQKRQKITEERDAKLQDVPNALARQWEQKQAEEAAAKAAARQQAVEAAIANSPATKALKWNMEQADKGDDYGLLRMGERYRDGDGALTGFKQSTRGLEKSD